MLFTLIFLSNSVYFPGNLPNIFKQHDQINVSVNALRSSIRPIPLDYFKNDIFCLQNEKTDLRSNIGEYLSGDALHLSPYSFKVGDNENCTKLCEKKYNASQKQYLIDLIENKYRLVLILDDIPLSSVEKSKYSVVRTPGYNVGYVANGEHYINNYISLNVMISNNNDGISIVGFDVSSLQNSGDECDSSNKVSIEQLNDSDTVTFSYSVNFELTNIEWYERWNDVLTIKYNPKYHIISLINTLLLVFALGFVIYLILQKIVKGDSSRGIDGNEDNFEDIGWQLIHGDVFRNPKESVVISAFVGSGFQLIIGTLIVLIIAAIGFLAPLNMGSMITTLSVAFIIAAPFGGFISSKLYHSIGKGNWKQNIILSTFCFNVPSLILYLVTNCIFVINDSSAALTFHSLLELLVLVMGIDCGLFFIGSILGLRGNPFEFPTQVNSIPRKIPKLPWFLNPFVSSLIAGFMIFSAIFVEVYFIYHSVWTNLAYYYLFGLLLIVFVSMQVLSAEISICFIYLHLLCEDYNWWWASFRISASSGIYFFLYSIFYMIHEYKPPDISSKIIYLIFSFIFSFALSIGNGTIGFLSSFFFVQKIYGTLKME